MMHPSSLPLSSWLVLGFLGSCARSEAPWHRDADPPDAPCVDGLAAEGVVFQDKDGDGYGNPEVYARDLEPGGEAVLTCGDCDDGDPEVSPLAQEVCDAVDNDCDGLVDEEVQQLFYRDSDGDGYGDPAYAELACSLPEGFSAEATDCNDHDPAVHPDAGEVCNDIDDDCDGRLDEADEDLSPWYRDQDWDGYGADDQMVRACEAPGGHVDVGGDCDDTDRDVYPGAPEVDPGVDNDCDGEEDNTLPVAVPALAEDSPTEQCSTLLLDGSASFDPDGDAIEAWTWAVLKAPSTASGVSQGPVDLAEGRAGLLADAAGSFLLGLEVSDGLDSSPVSTLRIDVTSRDHNDAPEVVIDSPILSSSEVVCEDSGYGIVCGDCAFDEVPLDASSAVDPDGDEFIHAWSLSSGEGFLSQETEAEARLHPAIMPATYGLSTTETTVVEHLLTDCMGATTRTTVEIVFECTAS